MDKNIIYGLRCPLTDEYKYIGKSTSGLSRAKSHLTYSHNDSVNIWVNELNEKGLSPLIDTLEECEKDELSDKEKFWIHFYEEHGCKLFNSIKYEGKALQGLKEEILEKEQEYRSVLRELDSKMSNANKTSISESISDRRKVLKITQSDLAELAGVSKNTIYKIETEQVNPTISIINQIYDVLGLELVSITKGR